MIRRRNGKGRGRQDTVTLAGWLFADLLLALAMLFFVFNTVGFRTPAPPTPLPTSTATRFVDTRATVMAAVQATLTLIAPTVTPTPLDTPTPTETPTSTPRVNVAATIDAMVNATLTAIAPSVTPTSLNSPTPTPTIDPTHVQATIEAIVAATLTALAPTQTPTPGPSPTPTPTPTRTPTPVFIDIAATVQAQVAATLTAIAPTMTPTPLPATPTPTPTFISGLSLAPVQTTIRVNTDALLAGNQAERNRVRGLLRDAFGGFEGAQRAGFVLTFGTDASPNVGIQLATLINSLLVEEMPSVFVSAVTRNFFQILSDPSQRGNVEIEVYLMLKDEREATATPAPP